MSKRIHCKPDPFDLDRLNHICGYVNDLNREYERNNSKKDKIIKSMQTRTIREITSSKFTNKLTKVNTYQANENLIYQRILGHKDDMPGSGQWIETSNETTPPELLNDWITDKSIYTLIFWSKSYAKQIQLKAEFG